MNLTWDKVALSDTFRTANWIKKSQIRNEWLTQVAPTIYGQQILQNPQLFNQVRESTLWEIPDKLPEEDAIIPKSSLQSDGYTKLELNPAFGRMKFEEQLKYRQVWYAKMANNDPDFKKIDPKSQEAYYTNLMRRPPSGYGSTIYDLSYDRDAFLKEFDQSPEWAKTLTSYIEQFSRNVVMTATSLIVGPIRAIAEKAVGKYNDFSAIWDNWSNFGEWMQYVSNANNPLPAFVGNIAGTMAGVFPAIEKGLAGTFKGATAGGKLIAQKGLLSTAGKALGARLPELVYQTTGGVVAGALQGVSQAMLEGKDWKMYLPQDIALGVVFEPLSRYVSALSQVKNAMKQAGYKGKISDFFKEPFQPMTGKDLSPAYTKILTADPRFKDIFEKTKIVDNKGFILENYTTKPVIDLRAELSDLSVKYEGDTATIFRKDGSILHKTTGNEQQILQRVSDIIDLQDVRNEFKINKSIEETIEATKSIELREGIFVPQGARKKIMTTLQQNGIVLGADNTIDPSGDSRVIDRIYAIIRKQGINKAADSLNALGIHFGNSGENAIMSAKEHKAVIRQLKADIAMLSPDASYFMVNSRTGKIIPSEEIPKVYLDSPYIKDPFVLKNTAMMNAEQLRASLSDLKKIYTNEKRAVTKLFKGKGVELNRFEDTRLVQMKLDIPDGDGITHGIIYNFNSPSEAYKFLRGGSDAAINRVFKESPILQEGFEQWKSSLSKTDLKKLKNDFLPYKFLAKQALDNQYYLSHYNGAYIIEDALDDSNRFHTFTNLKDAGEWLSSHDRLRSMGDMLTMSPEVFEELYPEGAHIDPMTRTDPFMQLEEIKLSNKAKWGLKNAVYMNVSPTQYVMEMFEKHPIGEKLRKAGMGPVEIINVMRRGVESANSWARTRVNFFHELASGMTEDMAKYGRDWWEALDDISEARFTDIKYKIKSEVEAEMINKFGQQTTDKIKDHALQIHRTLKELFYMAKLDPVSYERHYMPHLRSKLSRANVKMSQHFDLRRAIDQIPETDRKAFYEFLRETDAKADAFETNIYRIAASYVNAMARRRFLSPVLKEVADIIHKTKPLEGALEADYVAFTHYMAENFRSIYGMHTPGELTMKLASQATLENLAEKFKVPLKKNTVDIVQRLLTGATGSYLAFRPWSVGKQLTQSMITGAPVIGVKWWLEGINEVTTPGAIEKLMRIGLIDPGIIPTGSGFALAQEGKIAKVIKVGMIPYQWGDWVNRAIIYYGAQKRFKGAAKEFLEGKISKGKFLKRSGMHLFGAAQYNYALKLLKTNDLETGLKAAEDHIARVAANRTQYLYDRFEQPALFRNGIGRLAGQFASWPVNFLAYVSEVLRTKTTSTAEKARFLATLGGLSTLTATTFAQMGIRSEEFLPWNMALFQGGPYYQMMNDGLAAINGDGQRWGKFVRALTGLIPFSRAGESVYQAVQSFTEGNMWEGMLHLMSAPIYQDVMERPDIPIDKIEEKLIMAGNKFIEGKKATENYILGRE